MFHAVIFDLDGTLADTLPLCIESFRKAVHDMDGRMLTDEEISRHFGASDLGVIQRLFPGQPAMVRPAMELMIYHYRALHKEMAPVPFAGVVPLLATLRERGITLAMVTGKCIETARITLDEYGMSEFFPMVEPGSPRKIIKGECLLRIADHYALSPADMLYVGDTVGDIKACRQAGVTIASAGWAETADLPALAENNPNLVFTGFPECSEFILEATHD